MAQRDRSNMAKRLAARAGKFLTELGGDDDKAAEDTGTTPQPRTIARDSNRTITINTPSTRPMPEPDETAAEAAPADAEAAATDEAEA